METGKRSLTDKLEELKTQAKETLGEKKDPESYTEDSYQAYSEGFDELHAAIDAVTTEEQLDGLKVAENKAKLEALLKEKSSTNPSDEDPKDPSDEEEEPDEANLEEEKANAKKALGQKKFNIFYTEESYQAYSDGFDDLLAAIENATTVDELAGLEVVETKEKLEKLLKIDMPSFDGLDLDTDDDTEDEETDETSSDSVKLSGLSDEELTKIAKALLQGFGYKTTKNPKTFAALLKNARAQLRKVNESYGNLTSRQIKTLWESVLAALNEGRLMTTADAVKSVKATSNNLKSAAAGLKNMTSAMHEEYHKYANPKEISEMEYLFSFVNTAISGIINSVNSLGYSIAEYDRDGYMSGNNEYTEHIVFKSDDTFEEGEEADLAEQLRLSLENKLSEYELPNEITEVACDVLFPDEDVADALEDETTIPGTIAIYVTFARKLL